MKRNLIALALLVLSGSALFASAPVELRPDDPRLVVSRYGTLLKVLNADGSSRFDDLKLDGFWLKYQVDGTENTVWANGETDHSGLRPVQFDVVQGSVSVTVKTDDDALEITSRFTLNEQGGRLIISRSLKTSPGRHLNLLETKQYLDPKLISKEWSKCPPARSSAILRQQGRDRVRVKVCEGQCSDFEARPPTDPPCSTVNCTENLNPTYRAFLATEQVGACKRLSLSGRRKPDMTQMQFAVRVPLGDR
jgi:hypothetical protein